MAAGVMVISARNPVHSVLFLILAFFNAAGLFVLMGAEFLAMILVIVYVGAVAVLFLFVVMMLDIDFAELRAGLPALSADRRARSASILLAELLLVVGGWVVAPGAPMRRGADAARRSSVSNTEALGACSIPTTVYLFQAAGLVLLVAMIGAIVLTLRHRDGVRRQSIAAQVGAPREQIASRSQDVPPGSGI